MAPMSLTTPRARSTTACAIRNGGSACRRTRRSVSDRGLDFQIMWELTKSFRFEAAHSLPGTTLGEASEEIHGHSFRAEVTLRGAPDPATGMLADLTRLEQELEGLRALLDHKLLNRIERLGLPTLENL